MEKLPRGLSPTQELPATKECREGETQQLMKTQGWVSKSKEDIREGMERKRGRRKWHNHIIISEIKEELLRKVTESESLIKRLKRSYG